MSSLAYNLTRKLEWMGRRLRHINDTTEIQDWVATMKAINCLPKEVDIKSCCDDWQPWSQSNKKGNRSVNITITPNQPLPAPHILVKDKGASSKPATSVKIPSSQLLCVTEESARSGIQKTCADEIPSCLDAEMTVPIARLPCSKIGTIRKDKRARIMPPRVEVDPTSDESSSTSIINVNTSKNPLMTRNLSRALKKRLDEADVQFNHWDMAVKLKSLF